MANEDRPLTDKQLLFCQEYIKDLNAKQAAIRAGYSEKTAVVIGHELLNKTLVNKKITELLEGRSKRVGVEADTVLTELLKIAQVDIDPDDIRPSDKLKALEMVGRHLKMFTDKVEVEHVKPSIIEFNDGSRLIFDMKPAKKENENG